jgi:hypothetical protein
LKNKGRVMMWFGADVLEEGWWAAPWHAQLKGFHFSAARRQADVVLDTGMRNMRDEAT